MITHRGDCTYVSITATESYFRRVLSDIEAGPREEESNSSAILDGDNLYRGSLSSTKTYLRIKTLVNRW